MRIVFAGDLFTGGQLPEKDFESTRINLAEFVQADLRVCNLEQATSDAGVEAAKSTVFSPTRGVQFLITNRVNIVSLANNHIQDKGETGFQEGLMSLVRSGVRFVGAGLDIQTAEKSLSLTENLRLLAYCEFGKPYLRKVQIATDHTYGVNPFSLEKVFNDLDRLAAHEQAVLFIHWGKENVWFPPWENLVLARTLLEHSRVHSIVGAHAHRMQGKIRHHGKVAYFSLGNFLFPNFYLAPRTRMVYPDHPVDAVTTKEYHPVPRLTRKIWKYMNRISLMVVLRDDEYCETWVKQRKWEPTLMPVIGLERTMFKMLFSLLSISYTAPVMIYRVVSGFCNLLDLLSKYSRIFFFFIKVRLPWMSRPYHVK